MSTQGLPQGLFKRNYRVKMKKEFTTDFGMNVPIAKGETGKVVYQEATKTQVRYKIKFDNGALGDQGMIPEDVIEAE